MKISLKAKGLTIDESYKICQLTIQWCQKFFDDPHVKRRRPLVLAATICEGYDIYGWYCPINHWMIINLSHSTTIKLLIQTTIHEYVHSCQNLKEYASLTRKLGYDNNPLEVEARKNEKYYINCWRSIKQKL